MSDLIDAMEEAEERIHKKFEDEALAEQASADRNMTCLLILMLLAYPILVALNVMWNWLKSVLGF